MNAQRPTLNFQRSISERNAALAILCACALGAPALSATDVDPNTARASNQTYVRQFIAEAEARYAGNPDVLVRPGLIADRAEKRVLILAETTGIAPLEPVEFFLISENSGHDYEALAVAFALPSDVHKALEFIGVPAGQPVDSDVPRLWPKGERVSMWFEWNLNPDGPAEMLRKRAEELLIDDRTQARLPAAGLIFAGSCVLPDPGHAGTNAYAADAFQPGSIAANYNEAQTVLDIPLQRSKGEQYRHLSRNPETPWPRAQIVQVTLEPEYADGRRRVREIDLRAAPRPATATEPRPGDAAVWQRTDITLTARDGSVLLQSGAMEQALEQFKKVATDGGDPYVTVSIDDALPLGDAQAVFIALAAIEGPEGIRMDAPPAGQFFYKGFLPNTRFRERATRPSQPWELHLTRDGGKIGATLTLVKETYEDDKPEPTLHATDYPVTDSAALPGVMQRVEAALDASEARPPKVLLIFAPPEMTYGELRGFLAPVLATHSTIYVFL